MKKDIWVSPAGAGWKVQTEGAGRAAAIHTKQSEAIAQGREMAQRSRSELIIQGGDGKIREKNSYGNDPKRSRG